MIGVSVPGVAFGRAVIVFFLFLPVAFAITYIDWRRLSRTALRYSSFPPEIRQLALTCMLIGLTWLVSCALSIDPMKSFSTFARTLALGVMCYLLTMLLARDTQIFDTACKALIVANSAILLAAIVALYVDESLFDLYRSVKGYHASTIQTLKPYFSVAVCILPLVLWYGFRERGVWGILAVLHIPFTLLLIYGRGEQPGLSASIGLGSAVIALIGVWALTRVPRRTAWILVMSVILGITTFTGYIVYHLPVPPISEAITPAIGFPDWHRQVIWGFTIDIIQSAPVFGVGPNTVNLMPGANDLIPGMNQEYIPSHPHNWVLEIAAETGILGVALLLTAVLLGLRALFQLTKQDETAAWAAIALYSAFWTSSLGNFSIWSAWWLAVFAVLMSFPLAAFVRGTNPRAGAI